MTPKEQQVAIEEACGWTVWSCGVPDYLNDLNAMHEAEKVLDPKGKDGSYEYWLRTVCHIPERESANGRYFYRATASQRAEAFLRTIGKWKECK
jgi:hypothetical protein